MSDVSPAPAAAVPPVDPNAHLDDTPAETVNWEAMSDTSVRGNDDAETSDPGVTPTPTPAVTPTATPTPTAAPVAPVTPAPSAPAAAPTVPTPTPSPTPAPVPTPTPAPLTQEQINAQAAEYRRAAIEAVEKQYISELTDEDKRALLTDPEKVIPKLLAAAVVDGMQMAAGLMHQQMQHTLPAQIARNETSRRAEEAFYSVNQDLNRQEFKPVVLRVAQTVASMFPNASPQERMIKVAEMSRSAIGLPPLGAAAAAPAAPAAPAVPARPFTPAASGGSSPGRPASEPSGDAAVWAELASRD